MRNCVIPLRLGRRGRYEHPHSSTVDEATEQSLGVRAAPPPAPSSAQPRRHAGRGFSSALRGGRVAGLDGLRTVAVVLVIVYHVEPDLVPGGSVGVDVFFTLSGFVITRLLVAEYARTGRIGLGAFYRRRWRRLGPAMLAMCAVTALLSVALPLPLFDGAWVAAALAATSVINLVRAGSPGRTRTSPPHLPTPGPWGWRSSSIWPGRSCCSYCYDTRRRGQCWAGSRRCACCR